jgi:hypothetical protein
MTIQILTYNQGRRKASTTREIHTGTKRTKGAYFWLDISVLGARFLICIETHPLSKSLAPALRTTYKESTKKPQKNVEKNIILILTR